MGDKIPGFRLLPGYDMPSSSMDYKMAPQSDPLTCVSECQAERGKCVAVTYDRWNELCIFKEAGWVELSRNSKADTYLLNELASNLELSVARPSTYSLTGKTFRKNGEYKSVHSKDMDECISLCLDDSICDAVELTGSTCLMLSQPKAYEDGGSDTYIGFFEQRLE